MSGPLNKRKRETPTPEEKAEEPAQKSQRVTRSQSKPRPGPPTVTVVTVPEGVKTQKLGAKQKIGFRMDATLEISEHEPLAVTTLYAFRQYVSDIYQGHDPDESSVSSVSADSGDSDESSAENFDLDGPFKPPYKDEHGQQHGYITITQKQISFEDHPGFSTTQQIAVDKWLKSYTVEFFWTVTRLDDGAEWQSDTIEHTVTSGYAGGADADVTYKAAKKQVWVVNFD